MIVIFFLMSAMALSVVAPLAVQESGVQAFGVLLGPAVLLLFAALLYGLLLLLLYFTAKRCLNEIWALLPITLYLVIVHFILAIHTLYPAPHRFLGGALDLFCFLFAFCFFVSLKGVKLKENRMWQKGKAFFAFYLPFSMPFLLFQLIADGSEALEKAFAIASCPFWISGALSLMAASSITFVLLPVMMKKSWRLQPLEEGGVQARLLALADRAQLKFSYHRWPIKKGAAAMIGVFFPFRYLAFTDGLLQSLTVAEIETVAAHEMGHSYFYHLLFYPLILLSLFLLDCLLWPFFVALLEVRAEFGAEMIGSLFFLFLLLAHFFYFRLIFAFFYRAFEREADLFPLKLGLSLITLGAALKKIEAASARPSVSASRLNYLTSGDWHHYSFAERLDFLRQAAREPKRAAAHHRFCLRLKISAALVCLALALLCFFSL